MIPTRGAIGLGGVGLGDDYDQLLVSDALALGDAQYVTLSNGFNPMLGQTFNLFDQSSLIVEFLDSAMARAIRFQRSQPVSAL